MNNSIIRRTAILIAIVIFFISAHSVSQAQRLISYQGIVTDANNLPLTGEHSLTLRIYMADTGGSPLFQETQKVTLNSQGMFNVLIGSVKPLQPLSIADPASDRYYLSVQVDVGPELAPRSPLSDVASAFFADTSGYARSATYADTAGFARAIDPSSLTIVPTTVNGLSNAVTITGGGITTVSTIGNTISISSTESPAIRNLQSLDGTITIIAPSGPATSIGVGILSSSNLADGSITTAKLADGAVSNAKLSGGAVTIDKVSSGAISSGEVLTSDGAGGTVWQNVTANSISLPYIGTASSSSSIFSLTNTGTGPALSTNSPGTAIASATTGANGIAVQGTTSDGGAGTLPNSGVLGTSAGGHGVSGLTNTGDGVYASASTTGVALHAVTASGATSARAGLFENLGSGATGTVLQSNSIGTGSAGAFTVNNSSNGANALSSVTNGTGSAGLFQITNSTSTSSSLEATTGSTSGSANGVLGWASNASGAATGVYGQAEGQNAQGVHGVANNSTANGNGIGVYGETKGAGANGSGIYGWASNSSGGAFGVWGQAEGVGADAIVGLANNTSGNGVGVYGWSRGSTGVGIYGESDGSSTGTVGILGVETNSSVTSGTFAGVQGNCYTPSANGYGVLGEIMNSGPGIAVCGLTAGAGSGVYGQTTGTGYGVWGKSTSSGYAVIGQATSGTTTCTGVYGSGYWGVQGYTTFNAAYGVLGSASGGTGYGVFGTTGSASGSGTGVYAFVGSTSATSIGSSNALIANYGGAGTSTTTNNNIAIFTTGTTREFRFANNGQAYTVSGGAWNSGGADVAEAFDVIGSKSGYEPGDVLVLSPEAIYHVAKCSTPYSTCVAGVYATSPGVLLGFDGVSGDAVSNSAKVPMGVIGVIPTKVSGENGPIAVGDLLVTSSTPGRAMKGDPDKLRFGNVLGKAMEPFNSSGTGVIKVLVGKY